MLSLSLSLSLRPNKKNTWLASHSHKFSEAGGRGFFSFLLVFKFFNSNFGGGGWGRLFHYISDIFCTDVAKAAILL